MIPTLTDAELTILGLIAERPRHGYALENVIDERGIRNWTALGFSSIYYVLDKLADRKLIEPTGSERSGKSRTTFRVTELGRQSLVAASLDAIDSLSPLRARVLIGMANSPGLADSDVSTALTRRLEALRTQRAELRSTRSEQEPLRAAVSAIFEYGEAMLAADARWTEDTLAAIEKENTMDKYDVKVAHKELYAPSATDFSLVDVPELQYVAIDGHGDPNTSPDYAEAVESLYSVAYALKFESKKTLGRDFTVGPLEGLWRAEDMAAFVTRDKGAWDWTMMITQPDWITAEQVSATVEKVSSKKGLRALARLRFLTLDEGKSVQILHLGSYDDESPTLERLHKHYLPQNDLSADGDHHEIYLSDPRRTVPAKLKTILRQPVRPR